MIDLDEIERRIPSPATECAYCYRLATLVCPVCAVMVCEDHRAIAAHGATGEDCTDAAMVPAQHDAATMDRIALVAEVRRMRAENERLRAARDNAVDLWNRSLDDARRIETQRDEARRIAAGNEARYVAAERDLGEARRIAESRYQDIVDLDGRFRQREASIVSEARRWKVKAVEQSAEVRRLRAELATAREIADIADDVRVSQIKELYDVIDGSPDEPTDAELSAHKGTWLVRLYNGAYATMTAISARNARGVMMRRGPYAARWWALDPGERFCPRPVVTAVAATLDAGPRDADGREVTP